jgi:RNA polymerase sigma-70 factor (ECF subfamily)
LVYIPGLKQTAAGVFYIEATMMSSESSLINNALHGNTDAFGELVRLHQNRLFTAMVHVVGCPAEAEDVVQETFIRAFRKLDRFRGQANFYTWLYRIAFNRSVDRRRTQRPTRSLEAEMQQLELRASGEEQSPSRPLELQEQNQRVRQALSKLSESDRAILILREFEECDYTTIAEMLDLKVGTVRSRLHRARGHLMEELKSLDLQTKSSK